MKNNKFSTLENVIQEHYENMTGLVIMQKGCVVYEKYFHGYTANNTVHIASVTKSIISGLIGIAIDKGYIKCVDQNVLDFFPEYKIKRGEKTILSVKIEDLLTMTAPYKYKSEPFTKV